MPASADRELPPQTGGPYAREFRAGSLNLRPPLIAAVVLASIASAMVFAGHLPGEMRDFEVYWTAAGRALQAVPLYRANDGHFQFKYLPAFAVLAAPIGSLSLPAAKAWWFIGSAALLGVFVWLALAILPDRRRPAWILTAIVILAMGKFYGHELVLGQVNILFGVLVTTAILLLGRDRPGLAAMLLVGAVAVKPYAIVFLPWLAFVRGPRAGLIFAAGIAVLLAAPAMLYGFDGTIALHRQWWVTVTESTAPNLTNNDNVSIAGMFAKWLGIGDAASLLTTALTGLILALFALIVGRGRSVPRREALEGGLLLTMIPLLSPQGWDYVFLVATPAIALFANYDDRLPPVWRWTTWIAIAAIGLSLFDLMGRERYATFMSWSVVTICFIVLVAALAALRMRRAA